jgi:hypothetical protein
VKEEKNENKQRTRYKKEIYFLKTSDSCVAIARTAVPLGRKIRIFDPASSHLNHVTVGRTNPLSAQRPRINLI